MITSDAVGGARSINHGFFLLRNPPLIRSEYGRLLAFLREAYSYASLSPPEMREWRELAQRHRLEMNSPWNQISDVSLKPVSDGFPLPSNLGEVYLSESHAMASLSPFPVVFKAAWSSDRAAFATLSSSGEYLVPAHELSPTMASSGRFAGARPSTRLLSLY